MGYTIFDLDNCISNDGWRIPFIDWHHDDPAVRYHRYHLLSAFDELENASLLPSGDDHLVIFTARPKAYAASTQEWLRRKGLDPVALFMRPAGDHAHSLDLKRRHLLAMFSMFDADASEIVAAYDDRHDVVQMFKDHGLNAHQVQTHDVDAYTNPN